MRWLLALHGEPIIILNNYLDAIYDIENDILYFRDLGRIKPIFKGIEELYREATQQEVTDFLSNDFLELTDEYTALKVKSANRKRICCTYQRALVCLLSKSLIRPPSLE